MITTTILIVDDEIAIAKALEYKLQKNGHETVVANDGAAALKLLETRSFDIILLDLLMPEIDGWEVLAKTRGTKATIIVTSNLGQPEDIERAKAAGAQEFLVKSDTTLNEIVEVVEKYANSSEASGV